MQRLLKSIAAARPGLIGLLLALAVSTSGLAQTGTGGAPASVVAIVQPANGAVFTAPASIQIMAKVQLSALTNVVFYAGTNEIGVGVQRVLDPPGQNGIYGLVYVFTWTNVPAGNYTLTAVASGAGTIPAYVSPPVNISVVSGGPGPVIRITSPPNHAVFFQPSDIPIFAFAADISPTAAGSTNTNNYIANVEFYAGTNDLGPGHHVVVLPPDPLLPIEIVLPYEFTLVWSNPPAGQFALTAVATDGAGNTATSAPVNITIVPTKIITNGLDVVSIVASDPVAIAGTNCWVWPGLPVATPTWAAWLPAKPPVCVMYTNCGPKDTTFTVRRAGEITNDITVFYSIGGTASNGVDYAELPGVVTIPTGQNYAYINIVPAETNVPSNIKTVVLTLQPSESAGPAATYVVGVPKSAAAIIIDSSLPHPVTGPLPGPLFHLTAAGPDGAWFCVEASTDLSHWTPVSTNQVVNGCIDFVDADGMAGNRYYQAIAVTAAPLQ